MNTYTKTASYDITATLNKGVDVISELQKEVNTILAKAPALFFENKLAFLDEECFDADEALRPDFKEPRLQTPVRRPFEKQIATKRAERLEGKTAFVSKAGMSLHPKKKEPEVAILWENTRARTSKTSTFEKYSISLEELFLIVLQRSMARMTRAIREGGHILNRIAERAARNTPSELIPKNEMREKVVKVKSYKKQNMQPVQKDTMQYYRKKRIEFAVSTAVTFALFAFLLIQADFIPEAPHAVLEGQVAGPMFAVDATSSISVSEDERSVSATTSTSTPKTEARANNTTSPIAIQRSSTPIQNRTIAVAPRQNSTVSAPETVRLSGVLPERIIIDAIGLNVAVGIPLSRDIATIDNVLLRGAALYPGSGTLDQERNLLIMGHSSHLPVVRNQAYKAFNNIETLKPGAVIRIRSGTEEYAYHVTSVKRVPAAEALVNFNTGKRQLTLVTCDNFGEKSDRYVVEADFTEKYQI